MKAQCKVVKIGGNIINDKIALSEFLKAFHTINSPKVLVHGGGKMASQISADLGQEVQMVNGRRVTTKEGIKVATMVYSGWINTSICAQIAALGGTVIGLSGADVNIIEASKRPSKPVDYGFAGDIRSVNGNVLNSFIQSGFCPVLCSITHDGKGQLLNTNADTIAAEVAVTLSEFYEVDLFYCFEKSGVLKDISDSNSTIEQIDEKKYTILQEEGIIDEGMIPKLHNCFHAIKGGVQHVRIGNVHSMNQKEGGTVLKLEI